MGTSSASSVSTHCRTYKPARDVYDYVCRELDVAPADCMMVAAHVWDTVGAQSAGLQRGTDHPAGQRAAVARRPAAAGARRRRSARTRPAADYGCSRRPSVILSTIFRSARMAIPARFEIRRGTAATAARLAVSSPVAEEVGGEHRRNNSAGQRAVERAGQADRVGLEHQHRLAEHRRVARAVRVGVVRADGIGRRWPRHRSPRTRSCSASAIPAGRRG